MTEVARRDAGQPVAPRTAESLARSVLLQLPAVTDALVAIIYEQNSAYREVNSVPPDDLWRSCHDNVGRVMEMIAAADQSATDDYFDAARETGRRRAEQRMPLDDVLRSFRLGGRLVWEALIEEARAQGARTPEETAISIAAEIIATRTSATAEPLSSSTGPIHAPNWLLAAR